MNASLAASKNASSLRLRCLVNDLQKAEIGQRLRELRDNSPETNRSIADAVGVSERTVAEWISGRQGMTYDNAQKVAELFEADLDWFWRGKNKPHEGGSLMDALHGVSPDLKLVVERQDQILERLRVLEENQVALADRMVEVASVLAELHASQETKQSRSEAAE